MELYVVYSQKNTYIDFNHIVFILMIYLLERQNAFKKIKRITEGMEGGERRMIHGTIFRYFPNSVTSRTEPGEIQ